MPAAEVAIDATLVRALLADQHPDLTARELVEVASGWDNVLFRRGDDLAVRLPRRGAAAALIEHEQRWLPELAPRLPLAVPAPVRVGRPGRGYPWSWSVTPWLPGDVIARVEPTDPRHVAEQLGRFVRALHRPAPADAPANPYRGVPLSARSSATYERLDGLGDAIDQRAVRRLWEHAVAIPPWTGAPLWLHGDLHPANILVHDGHVSAVIDFGDVTSGDPATDLAVAWTLLPSPERARFRATAGEIDDETWARARGWALTMAIAYLASSADNPLMDRIGRRTLAAVLADVD